MGHFIAQLSCCLANSEEYPATCFGNASVTYWKYMTFLCIELECVFAVIYDVICYAPPFWKSHSTLKCL